MDPIYWAALFSFVAGAGGYVIVRFWIIPIVRYQKLKRQLGDHLARLIEALPTEADTSPKPFLGKKHLKEMRRMMMRLVDLNNHDLPYWYRLVLVTRKESPGEASEVAMRLENLPTSGQARKCLEQVVRHLTIKGKLTRFTG